MKADRIWSAGRMLVPRQASNCGVSPVNYTLQVHSTCKYGYLTSSALNRSTACLEAHSWPQAISVTRTHIALWFSWSSPVLPLSNCDILVPTGLNMKVTICRIATSCSLAEKSQSSSENFLFHPKGRYSFCPQY